MESSSQLCEVAIVCDIISRLQFNSKEVSNMRKRLFFSLLVPVIFFQTQLALAQAGRTAKEQTTAQPQFINPSGLSKPNGYTHVVIVQPERLVYVSGQVAWNPSSEIQGKDDLRAQVTQVMENLKTALATAGASLQNVIKLNYYVVNLNPDKVSVIREVRKKYLSAEHPPASTLVGVTALAREEFLIEVEAVAAPK
jgi:enamine deaminase RidA (YjgF/YER057c/UK114 family)